MTLISLVRMSGWNPICLEALWFFPWTSLAVINVSDNDKDVHADIIYVKIVQITLSIYSISLYWEKSLSQDDGQLLPPCLIFWSGAFSVCMLPNFEFYMSVVFQQKLPWPEINGIDWTIRDFSGRFGSNNKSKRIRTYICPCYAMHLTIIRVGVAEVPPSHILGSNVKKSWDTKLYDFWGLYVRNI